MERGAGALTFEEIAQVAGVTRGGITYHFPTKQRLLKALVEQDLEQWKRIEDENFPKCCPDGAAELVAFIRAHTAEEPERRRFVTGMMSAVTLDPPILDPARDFERQRLADVEWTDATLRQHVLRLAAMGLFWANIFDCPELPPSVRRRLVDTLEQLAIEWTADAEPESTTQTENQ